MIPFSVTSRWEFWGYTAFVRDGLKRARAQIQCHPGLGSAYDPEGAKW